MARSTLTLFRLSHVLAPRFPLGNPGLALAILFFVQCITFADVAQARNRSLTLYNTHTKETQTITYKRGGRFDAKGLRQMNRFLRDWRRNEITKMDPNLFDLIWEIVQKTGAKKPVHVVSGYRSPATNNMLRRRSRAVAKQSRHTKGQAMDFYLPGVSVKKIREVGLRMQAGGVGYYPSSRSPFVHIDTGTVRHWPRMTRKQLVRVFPRGNTVHVPRDRKPLKGYKTAKLQVQKRKAAMARSARSVGRFTQVVKAAPARPSKQQIASLSKTQQDAQPGLLQKLLRRQPKSPPKPVFDTATKPAAATATKAAPVRITALPRPRPAQLGRPIIAASLDLAGEQEATSPAIAPITALPRPRPTAQFKLASAQPATPLPKATHPVADASTANIATSTQEDAATSTSNEPKQSDPIQIAALPSPREASALPQAKTRPASQPEQFDSANGSRILASLGRQTAETEGSENRFSYAASEDAFVAKLPSGIPRAAKRPLPVPKAAERSQIASRSTPEAATQLPRPAVRPQTGTKASSNPTLGALPKAKAARAVPKPTARPETPSKAPRDQFAKLTFAYGLSGMGHITHVKQATKTASFAKLSRPIPSNLRALVSKPDTIIDQSFSRTPVRFASDDRFTGPIFAKMTTRSFN